MGKFPVARLIRIHPPGILVYTRIAGIFADTRTKKQHDDVWLNIELGKHILAENLSSEQDREKVQKILDNYCAGISRDFGVECHGIMAWAFDGFQYATTHPLFQEAISNV